MLDRLACFPGFISLNVVLLAVVLLTATACESPYGGAPEDVSPEVRGILASGEMPEAAKSNDAAAPSPPSPAPEVSPSVAVAASPGSSRPGFVVWESNRSGAFRLWRRELGDDLLPAGAALRLTPEERGRAHCCPHIAPDGRSVVYVSLPAGEERYPDDGASGPLRLIRPDGSGERTLVPEARTYAEHRAVIWRSPEELIYIDGDGRTRIYRLDDRPGGGPDRGPGEILLGEPRDAHGWLIDPTLCYATTGWPTFSSYDDETRQIRRERELGGCQPYFSPDGRWGYWVAGAGGPVNALDLANRQVKTILRKSDPQLPEDLGYIYFPMLSPSGQVLAVAGSNDEHSHHEADYEILILPIDPESLTVLGPARRITDHPSTDRFPAAWSPPLDLPSPPSPPPPPPIPPPSEAGWPGDDRGLVFLWSTADGANTIEDPVSGEERRSLLDRKEAEGRAWFDRHGAMVLRGGRFWVERGTMETVLAGCRQTNEFTLEATILPREPADGPEPARLVSFASGERDRNFSLEQQGDHLLFRLRTGTTGKNAEKPRLKLGRIPIGEATHVLVTYTPGRLRAFVNGEEVLESNAIQSGFFHWQERGFLFGNESGGVDRPWHGSIWGVAIYNRAFDADRAADHHERARAWQKTWPEVPTLRLSARLERRSPTPSLAKISPYRDALAVYEYTVSEILEGSYAADRIRIAHRVLANGERLPIDRRGLDAEVEMEVTLLVDNPQLESFYVENTLSEASGAVYFSPQILP